jgi:hypothetical protein
MALADMINHSFEPTCSYRWRKRDRMLEVVINAGQTIQEGDEVCYYLPARCGPSNMETFKRNTSIAF